MRLIDAHTQLLKANLPVFTTADAAACLKLRNATVSAMLVRLASAGHLVKLGRGLWTIPGKLNTLQIAHYLTAPFPAYVSLQSALFHHGLISQIPDVVYMMSLARTHTITTAMGVFSVHHVQPAFFFGYSVLEDGVTRMALPEKALIDFLYLGPARSKLFRALPELDLPHGFSIKRAGDMIRRIPALKRRALVRRQFEAFLRK